MILMEISCTAKTLAIYPQYHLGLSSKALHMLTLIEILITLTIASILLSYGIPNLKDFLTRQSLTTKANDILVDLVYARSEAINGGTPVSIIATPTWDKGWKIVTDNNGDGVLETLRI